ncbi:MAG: hypothetical protein AVDCRST_MAG90-2182, partial [uncultured Microvirga sp.]
AANRPLEAARSGSYLRQHDGARRPASHPDAAAGRTLLRTVRRVAPASFPARAQFHSGPSHPVSPPSGRAGGRDRGPSPGRHRAGAAPHPRGDRLAPSRARRRLRARERRAHGAAGPSRTRVGRCPDPSGPPNISAPRHDPEQGGPGGRARAARDARPRLQAVHRAGDRASALALPRRAVGGGRNIWVRRRFEPASGACGADPNMRV